MTTLRPIPAFVLTIGLALSSGCVGVPTAGEKAARQQQRSVEQAYRPGGQRPALPELKTNAPLRDFLHFAMLNQPQVEAAYYDWAASVQRITVERSLPEGRERYPIRVRYLREFREDIPELEKILIPTSSGAQVPLAQAVTIKSVLGPQEIKGERGLLVGYVTMNTRDRDEVSVVEDAERALQAALREGRLTLPAGYYWEWSGQFESQVRATKRMQILVPACLAIMFVMLYLGFQRKWIAPVIFLGMMVSAAGGFIMLALWGANLSVAVWVGFLVLLGVVDDDGVVISTYLEGLFKGRTFRSVAEIRETVLEAGLKRIRPCLMTLSTTVFGLMPIFWSTGRGSDVMQPMAIPSVGGMVVSLFVTIFIAPCLFCAVEELKWKRQQRHSAESALAEPELVSAT